MVDCYVEVYPVVQHYCRYDSFKGGGYNQTMYYVIYQSYYEPITCITIILYNVFIIVIIKLCRKHVSIVIFKQKL